MQNIPVFFTSGGTAALVLKEIPHRAVGYIRIQTVTEGGLPALLSECGAFLRGCGAEKVYVSQGPEPLPDLPHSHDMLYLHRETAGLPAPGDSLRLAPMTPENDPIFQRIYNRCFAAVTGAATYDRAAIAEIYRAGHRAFLALDGEDRAVGMGELRGSELAAVGILPEYQGRGLGRALTLSLLACCPGPEVHLTAVSDNAAALGLYESLGFRVGGLISRWYRLEEQS